ncbi:hypothetical protein F5B19DRAFT_495178 [Rostrohypoxylon terebratum]|nr:hypothetical protein F5B19DRAFT_495178 [Rostrohypoxylon terebratum]
MAILKKLPGVQLTMKVAGYDTIKYNDPDTSEHIPEAAEYPISLKYIECIDGADFTIRYCIINNYCWNHGINCLDFSLTVDRTHIQSRILNKNSARPECEIKYKEFYDQEKRQWQGQKLKFSAVTTVDDASKDRIKRDTVSARNQHKVVKAAGYELSEKTLKGKAISHGTSFSTPETIVAPRFVDAERIGDRPIAIFRFHYRSRDALKREMIIPRTPSPSEDPRAGIARMSRAEFRTGDGVKQERKPNIKQELKRKASEVIDLSDDKPRRARSPVFVDLTDD